MKEKLSQVSFLFVFATALVVIGHSDITLDYKQLWIFKWVYTFHMPLFFLVSGFLFAYTNPPERMRSLNIGKFIMKKVKRLLLPYWFITSVIFFVKSLIISPEQMQHPLAFSFSAYCNSLFFHSIGFMWFLPALFVIFCIFIFLKCWIFSKYLQIGGGILCFFIYAYFPVETSFIQFFNALHYSGFFLLGIIYFSYKNSIDAFLLRYKYLICILLFIFSAMLIDISLIAALVGILFSISLSLMVKDFCVKRMNNYANYTYTIFLLSYFPQMFIRGPIAHICPEVNQYLLSVLSFFSGFFIPIFIGMFILRLKKQYRFVENIAIFIGL